jgi:hypothetical protein
MWPPGGAEAQVGKAKTRAAVVDRDDDDVTGGSAVDTGGGAEETDCGAEKLGASYCDGSRTEADGRDPDITDTRLIGFHILPGISLSE